MPILFGAEAQYNAGEQYFKGKNYAKALPLFLSAARKGYTLAECAAGNCFFNGYGTPVDFRQGVFWSERAAQKGLGSAIMDLAWYYVNHGKTAEDFIKAFYWSEKSHQLGDVSGTNRLGLCYENGYGTAVDKRKALELYKQAADRGFEYGKNNYDRLIAEFGPSPSSGEDAEVLYKQADQYYFNKEYDKAFPLYMKAAQMGYAPAEADVGYCYMFGYGTAVNYAEGVYWSEKAAAKGRIEAQSNLAWYYVNHGKTADDFQKAFYWSERSHKSGDVHGTNRLGLCYENGYGTAMDKRKALELYKQAADREYEYGKNNYDRLIAEFGQSPSSGENAEALWKQANQYYDDGEFDKAFEMYWRSAQMGYAPGEHGVGFCYLQGFGVEEDEKQGVYWEQKAAEKGNAWAQDNLASYYIRNGKTAEDFHKAFYWAEKCYHSGSDGANNLGTCYEKGYGTAVDKYRALELYKEAAAQGSDTGKRNFERLQKELGISSEEDAETLYKQGDQYYNNKEFDKAFTLYMKAAQMGYAPAEADVGYCYFNGHGTTADFAQGVYWAQRAAEKGNAAAMGYLAGHYIKHGKTKEEDSKAFYWSEKSYQAGNGGNNLGVCYENGYGVPVDKYKALELYKEAADKGNQTAKENYEKLKAKLGQSASSGEDAETLWKQGNQYYNNKEYDKAFPLYMRAAHKGYAPAEADIGYCYFNGHGTLQNFEQGLYWTQKAVDKGDASGIAYMSWYYTSYCKTEEEYKKAFYWSERSYRAGNSANNLGRCYEEGYGVPVDKHKALELFKEAADKGSTIAKENYDRLKAELDKNPAQQTVTPPPAPSASPAQSAQEKLAGLTGLDSVKRELKKTMQFMELQEKRKKAGKRVDPVSLHMVFTGNPGTGKTTVARIVAQLYYERGFIKKPNVVEVDRSDLVAGYVGQTTEKTEKKIEEAMGGILFIDEAYTLAGKGENDYGPEAIDTILKAMEDHRDELMVIAAGYTEEMRDFIGSNPGLKSRFKTFLEFPDYKAEELERIFYKMAEKGSYKVADEAKNDLTQHFQQMYKARTAHFANAREVRNFYENVIAQRAPRVLRMAEDDDLILPEDIRPFLTHLTQENGAGLEKLNALVGLDSVKREVRELAALAQYRKFCVENRMEAPTVNMHVVFSGNPGTGKTTVARLVAQIYHEFGLLPTANCVEVDRGDLVAGYVGQTTEKTEKKIEEAMGGVLFIDEAYTLANKAENDYGKQAIDALLKAMEDHAGNLVVIVAGYTQEMKTFIASNPGLKSRFTKTIHFEDYDVEALTEIFRRMAKGKTITGGAQRELERVVQRIYDQRDSHFGNAREMRNLYEAVIKKMALRVCGQGAAPTDKAALNSIEAEDILEAEKEYFKHSKDTVAKTKPIGFYPD